MSEVLFCLDSESLKHPGLVGLGDERLESLPWMHVCCTAQEARSLAKDGAGCKEVWVASCDDMDAINLAAAIQHDGGPRKVLLVSEKPTGSVMSRARMAGIETVLDARAFARHYAKAKRAYAVESATAVGGKMAVSIAVTSSAGGSGKSVIAALVATMAARSGLRTLLIDANLQYGDIFSMVKDAQELVADDVLTEMGVLAGLSDEYALTVLVPPSRLEQAESLSCELPTLLDMASALFDVVVIDAGPLWDDVQVSFIERCTKTLFVVDQRASSVRSAKRALDLLIRCGVATGPVQFALNRCAKSAPYSALDVSCALQGASVFELKDGGREVEEVAGIGMVESLISERNPLAESVAALVGDWLPASEAAGSRKSGGSILGKLKGSSAQGRSARRKEQP